MTVIASTHLAHDDPRREGRVNILYDTHQGGYSSQGTRGTTLAKALGIVCAEYPDISVVTPEHIDGALTLMWKGWQISIIGRDGSPVLGDDTLYPSMYLAWTPVTDDGYRGGEEEPCGPLAGTDPVLELLRMQRKSVGLGPNAGSYKQPGLKDKLFEFLSSHEGWEPVPAN